MIALLDSITKAERLDGVATLSGSHGGVYAAYLAARAHALAVVLHDASVGRDRAGLACLDYCEGLGMAAAVVDYKSARIGNAADMLERGRISFVNEQARALGCIPGMSCKNAMPMLEQSPSWSGDPPVYGEGESEVTLNDHAPAVLCLDSASMVIGEHQGRIIATGSHGALIGTDPEAALKADARAALFNDAGIGIDGVGTTRLPALDGRGIAAATVSAASARIGDGRSTLLDGVLSAVNAHADSLGARVGMPARDWAEALLSH